MHLRTPNSNLPKLDADSALCILGNCCATIGKYFHANKTQKFKLPTRTKLYFPGKTSKHWFYKCLPQWK